MEEKTKEIYSEVYGVLNYLGDYYINKLPKKLYNLVLDSKSEEVVEYEKDVPISEQNISKEALSMIALFHLNYWCNSKKERDEILNILNENEKKYQKEIKEKYDPNNIFKTDENINNNSTEEIENKNVLDDNNNCNLVDKSKISIFIRIKNKILSIFKRD